jgi:hypothetical protein
VIAQNGRHFDGRGVANAAILEQANEGTQLVEILSEDEPDLGFGPPAHLAVTRDLLRRNHFLPEFLGARMRITATDQLQPRRREFNQYCQRNDMIARIRDCVGNAERIGGID